MQIQLTEKGLVTFCVVVACTTLLIMGRDTVVGYSLLGVVCGYYGVTIVPPKISKLIQNGKKKGGKNA